MQLETQISQVIEVLEQFKEFIRQAYASKSYVLIILPAASLVIHSLIHSFTHSLLPLLYSDKSFRPEILLCISTLQSFAAVRYDGWLDGGRAAFSILTRVRFHIHSYHAGYDGGTRYGRDAAYRACRHDRAAARCSSEFSQLLDRQCALVVPKLGPWN